MDSDTNSSEVVSVSVHLWSIYVWNLWKWIFRQSCYDSILSAVRSPDSVRNFVKMFPDVCLSILCLDPVWCLDSARILETVCCLFVRSDKDEAELSGLSLSFSADFCHTIEPFLADDVEYVQYDLYHIKCEHRLSVIPSYALWSIQLSHEITLALHFTKLAIFSWPFLTFGQLKV